MFDVCTRWSTRLFAGAAASGALSYLHGLCGAIMEELEHRGFASWLGSASTGFFVLAAMLMLWSVLMLSAEQQALACAPAQSEPTPPQLAVQTAVPTERAPETADRLFS